MRNSKKTGKSRAVKCHVCNGNATLLSDPFDFFQVTSDCKPWKEKTLIAKCINCGCIIKVIDRKWQKSVKKIYDEYEMYHQSGGIEQAVFDIETGAASLRSKRLIDYILSKITIPEKGNILDIGCGNGNLLRIFNDNVKGWNLAGIELNDKYKNTVENISKTTVFYSCPVSGVPGKFELISMLHVLEHVVKPVNFLKKVKTKLTDDGFIVIDLPDYQKNPFDLLIADHCTHFDIISIAGIVESAGFEIVDCTTEWIPKEISLIAKKGKIIKDDDGLKRDLFNLSSHFVSDIHFVSESLNWLNSLRDIAKMLSKMDNFGVFGTSIAAGWLFGELNGKIDFFVDEDRNRIGKTFLGKPIYKPEDIEKNSHVLIALPLKIAEKIYKRLYNKEVKYYLPPPFEL